MFTALKNRTADVAFPYFAAQLLTSLSISVPHAILTPLLLAKGLTLSEILVIQSAFSVTVLLAEFPSGVIADLFNRRAVYVVSRVVLVAFSLLVLYGAEFKYLLVAWILYGFSTALDTGTLDAALANNAKHTISDTSLLNSRLSWLVRCDSRSNLIGMLIGSIIGALLYPIIGFSIYWVAVAATVLSIVTIMVYFRIPEQRQVGGEKAMALRTLLSHFQQTKQELQESSALKSFLLLSIVVDCGTQMHYQLWQAVALEKGIPETVFLGLYLFFITLSIVASYFKTERLSGKTGIIVAGIVLWGISAAAFALLPNAGFMVAYAVLVILLTLLRNYTATEVRRCASIERIGAVTSLVSVCARVGSVVTLVALSYSVKMWATTSVVASGFLVVLLAFVAWWLFSRARKLI